MIARRESCLHAKEADELDTAGRIRAAREALGLTQQELGREIGVTSQHISRIEGSRVAPSVDLVVKLAQALGITTDFLLTGADRVPADLKAAIRAEQGLTPRSKRALLVLLDELRGNNR